MHGVVHSRAISRPDSVRWYDDGEVNGGRGVDRFDTGRWVRAVRRKRSLSQRELAELAQVPPSAISDIESSRRSPGVDLLDRILSATGHRLTVVDTSAGTPTILDEDHDSLRDRANRRLPAHLEWGDRPTLAGDAYWWGWHRVAWYDEKAPAIPEHAYWQRPRPARGPLRQHPWFGQFRARGHCFGPASAPCQDCVGDCRFRGDPNSR